MDDDFMKVWTEEIWLKNTEAESKRLGFENSLLSFNAAYLIDGVKVQLLESNSDILQYKLVVPRNANQWVLALTK